jgi:hypothetical protein
MKSMSTPAKELQLVVSMAAAARSFQHVDIAERLIVRAKSLGSVLYDSISTDSAVGFFLLGLFHMGEDWTKAHHFLAIGAATLCFLMCQGLSMMNGLGVDLPDSRLARRRSAIFELFDHIFATKSLKERRQFESLIAATTVRS